MRPAYTDSTLAEALREGRDPSGRALDPMMPRYQLNDADMGHLIAYLKSLASAPTPGVDASFIHFATVVADEVALDKRQAMLQVLQTFVRHKNTTTRSLFQRPNHSPWHHDQFERAYREWVLHVWELQGPPSTWPAQLATYYRNQPVFALLSGIGASTWQPVHEFCESAAVPCLFPHTNLPTTDAPGGYALYFSKGLTGEAQVLARYLRDTRWTGHSPHIVQIYRDRPNGRLPAQALRATLQGATQIQLHDRVITATQPLTPDLWKQLLAPAPPERLILWLDDADVETLAAVRQTLNRVQQLYLSYSRLNNTLPILTSNLYDKTYLTYPFTLPEQRIPRLHRVRGWMRSRGIKLTHERLQLNTHFALSITDYALMHLVENFSRDYFIESVEHETENTLNPGIFPHLSLGPGQRFASKGAYIIKLSRTASSGFKAVSDWIVP